MMHIAICDDNPLHLAATRRLVERKAAERSCGVCVSVFSSADALLQAFAQQETQAEIAILDISMNGMDGIALAKRLNAGAPRCQIVFLTGYITYAMDVYEVDHVYLVLKTMQETRLWPAVEKAWERYCAAVRDTVAVRGGAGTIVLRCGEIVCLELQGRKTCVRLAEREIFTRDSLDTLAEQLPDRFVRCHKSFLVNLDYVRELGASAFLLNDGTSLPISRSCKKRAEERFWAYMRAPGPGA